MDLVADAMHTVLCRRRRWFCPSGVELLVARWFMPLIPLWSSGWASWCRWCGLSEACGGVCRGWKTLLGLVAWGSFRLRRLTSPWNILLQCWPPGHQLHEWSPYLLDWDTAKGVVKTLLTEHLLWEAWVDGLCFVAVDGLWILAQEMQSNQYPGSPGHWFSNVARAATRSTYSMRWF